MCIQVITFFDVFQLMTIIIQISPLLGFLFHLTHVLNKDAWQLRFGHSLIVPYEFFFQGHLNFVSINTQF